MLEIAGRSIGPDHPPYFIADIGANHDGSIDRAIQLIALAAEAGADAVKFQNFRAETIVSRRGFDELGKIGHQAEWGQDVYDTYRDASMPFHWVPELAQVCKESEVAFMTTPYDLELVDMIDQYVPAWKIGSGDVTWHELIRHVTSKGKPVVLATGASTADEVDMAVGAYQDGIGGAWAEWPGELILLQCNTNYTADPSNIRYLNLEVLRGWLDRYGYTPYVGLSDHTVGHTAVVGAVALGACVIEKHFTDNSSRQGPDHKFAMMPEEWQEMVEAACDIWTARGDGNKWVEDNEKEARVVQRRALRYRIGIQAGLEVRESDLIAVRPCPEGGLEPWRKSEVVGRRLARNVEFDELVRREDFIPDTKVALVH